MDLEGFIDDEGILIIDINKKAPPIGGTFCVLARLFYLIT
jgi:hypothetical protein